VISIYKTTVDYLRYDVYVDYKIQQQIPSPFPVISICNLKSMNKNLSMDFIDAILTENDLKNLSDLYDTPLDTITMQSYLFKASMIVNKNLTIIRKFGFELDDMLLSCSFGTKYCCSMNFTWFFHNLYGNCFTFNDGSNADILKITIPGHLYGLQLEIFLGEPKLQTKYETNDGMIVFVHNQSAPVHMLNHGVLVSTNTETNIGIKRTFLKRLPEPHGTCIENLGKHAIFNSYLFDYIVRYLNVTYSQQLCFNLCMQAIIQASCNCSNAEMPLFLNGPKTICMLEHDLNCMFNALGDLDQQTIDSKCMRECPLECDSIFYDTSFSTATYPSLYYRRLLLRNPKINSTGIKSHDIAKSVLKVNIFYENLQYSSIEEVELMTADAYVAAVGGTVGLFLGMSLLSLIDLVQFFMRFICIYIFSKTK
jgi:hypothetical protein